MEPKTPNPDDEPTEFNVIIEPSADWTYRKLRTGWLKVVPKLDPECERQLRAVLLAFHPEAASRIDGFDDVSPIVVQARPE